VSKLDTLAQLGQAVWLDYIRRAFIDSGELQALVEEGLRGVTSNPTIFEKAIAGSADYDQDLKRLVAEGKPIAEVYEALVLEDIARAADILRPVYERTGGLDGYVSLEVSPALAHATEATVAEGKRLFESLGRPNVMIKVPATSQGIPAIRRLIGAGINVNVTLLFSVGHYEAVAEAYLGGLETLASSGGDLARVASVASFFVSRVDTAVDTILAELGEEQLQGTIAVANAKVAYNRFTELFSGPRWESLAEQGARVQRVLWASTGTKNPLYSDTLYVDELIGEHTVNTMPPGTLNAFRDHGSAALAVQAGLPEARSHLERLGELGVELEAITQKLQDDGVASFSSSFENLMASIAEKRQRLSSGWRGLQESLGAYQAPFDRGLAETVEQGIIGRIWHHDHSVWKPEPTEITNRLGWLHSAGTVGEDLSPLTGFVEQLRGEGYRQALLLGMGGSSLAPEVFSQTFGTQEGYLELSILDSTDPQAVLAAAEALDLSRTLFLVSTKSGGTVETLSFFKFFYNRVAAAVGGHKAGEHFVAITDPGSKLADLAKEYGFRATFLNDPNIGGRYSALSYFGLVPAALIGMDVQLLLDRALEASSNSESCNCPRDGDNLGGRLGVILGELAKAGRDKLTIHTSEALRSFGDWVEQLIAESTGKEGRGIVPIIGEPLGPPEVYGSDRLFVYLAVEGQDGQAAALSELEQAGHPVVRLNLKDLYDLGGQFFLWELATAVAGYRLGINPFDQPNVESAKIKAREMVAAFQSSGTLPQDEAAPPRAEELQRFLSQSAPGDYVALQAYLQPTQATTAALQQLRGKLRDRLKVATTLGYGPRFLHSTGQLHKGDGGRGLFVQFTCDAPKDVAIPDTAGSADSSISFGTLKTAQALGDKAALADNGRRVIRFHLSSEPLAAIRALGG
jgi:transaldolase/glucose-6-phosphate isomerase